MIVRIETNDLPFVMDLQADPPEGVNVTMQMDGTRGWGDTVQSVEALINIGALAFLQFLPWFVSKWRNRKPKKLKINGVEVEVDERIIEAVIRELLTEAQQSDEKP